MIKHVIEDVGGGSISNIAIIVIKRYHGKWKEHQEHCQFCHQKLPWQGTVRAVEVLVWLSLAEILNLIFIFNPDFCFSPVK